MFTWPLLILHYRKNPSNPSTEGAGPVLEHNDAFEKWQEQWMQRIQASRANDTKVRLPASDAPKEDR